MSCSIQMDVVTMVDLLWSPSELFHLEPQRDVLSARQKPVMISTTELQAVRPSHLIASFATLHHFWRPPCAASQGADQEGDGALETCDSSKSCVSAVTTSCNRTLSPDSYRVNSSSCHDLRAMDRALQQNVLEGVQTLSCVRIVGAEGKAHTTARVSKRKSSQSRSQKATDTSCHASEMSSSAHKVSANQRSGGANVVAVPATRPARLGKSINRLARRSQNLHEQQQHQGQEWQGHRREECSHHGSASVDTISRSSSKKSKRPGECDVWYNYLTSFRGHESIYSVRRSLAQTRVLLDALSYTFPYLLGPVDTSTAHLVLDGDLQDDDILASALTTFIKRHAAKLTGYLPLMYFLYEVNESKAFTFMDSLTVLIHKNRNYERTLFESLRPNTSSRWFRWRSSSSASSSRAERNKAETNVSANTQFIDKYASELPAHVKALYHTALARQANATRVWERLHLLLDALEDEEESHMAVSTALQSSPFVSTIAAEAATAPASGDTDATEHLMSSSIATLLRTPWTRRIESEAAALTPTETADSDKSSKRSKNKIRGTSKSRKDGKEKTGTALRLSAQQKSSSISHPLHTPRLSLQMCDSSSSTTGGSHSHLNNSSTMSLGPLLPTTHMPNFSAHETAALSTAIVTCSALRMDEAVGLLLCAEFTARAIMANHTATVSYLEEYVAMKRIAVQNAPLVSEQIELPKKSAAASKVSLLHAAARLHTTYVKLLVRWESAMMNEVAMHTAETRRMQRKMCCLFADAMMKLWNVPSCDLPHRIGKCEDNKLRKVDSNTCASAERDALLNSCSMSDDGDGGSGNSSSSHENSGGDANDSPSCTHGSTNEGVSVDKNGVSQNTGSAASPS